MTPAKAADRRPLTARRVVSTREEDRVLTYTIDDHGQLIAELDGAPVQFATAATRAREDLAALTAMQWSLLAGLALAEPGEVARAQELLPRGTVEHLRARQLLDRDRQLTGRGLLAAQLAAYELGLGADPQLLGAADAADRAGVAPRAVGSSEAPSPVSRVSAEVASAAHFYGRAGTARRASAPGTTPAAPDVTTPRPRPALGS
jgi:hypothetical protein